jgi:hypothetical protein
MAGTLPALTSGSEGDPMKKLLLLLVLAALGVAVARKVREAA